MVYRHAIDATTYVFNDLRHRLAKATPPRSGDRLAGIAADSAEQMIAARIALADVPLKQFLHEAVVAYEDDEITRLIIDTHDKSAFAAIASLTVGSFRDWLLSDAAPSDVLKRLSRGVTPEMAAAVSKLMRNQDLILVAKKCQVTSAYRNTIGLRGRRSGRLQPNHPFDDAKGITAAILDCVLAHVTPTLGLIDQGSPVDLVFQSIAGTQAANRSFGIDLALLRQAHQAGLSLRRGTVGNNVMYFETGQGSALSANAHHGVDQQTCEARAYAVARKFEPLLVNTVVGFIGPEYLYDGRQIVRAGLEDHFCGKLLGVPMGCDVCYTNHAEADQNDMDTLLTLLAVAGVTYIMGVPGSDDIMLNYQSTSFHDALYARRVLGLRPAPEFEAWLQNVGVFERGEALRLSETLPRPFQRALSSLA